MDDHEILFLLQQRSQHAIPALAQRFGLHLYRTALNLLGSPQDAEECVNDTYMAVWNSVPPNHPEPLQPYIYRIGRNIALNRLRSNSAQKTQRLRTFSGRAGKFHSHALPGRRQSAGSCDKCLPLHIK